MKKPGGYRASLNVYNWSKQMIAPKITSPMHRVNLPAPHLQAAYWDAVEVSLRVALRSAQRVAAEQQAVQKKQVAL